MQDCNFVSTPVDSAGKVGAQAGVPFDDLTLYRSLAGALHAEVEYRGIGNVVSELCWIFNLLLDLGCPLRRASLVYTDNASAIYLFENPVQRQRTKHIDIDILFVREKIQRGQVQALNCLHHKGIFHGDLKPRNILIYDGDVIKICDFGLAQVMWKTNKELQERTNTFKYMAPETLLSKNFLSPADLWSLGIVLYELLGGHFPGYVHGGATGVTRWHETDWRGNYPLLRWSTKISPDLESLVMRLLDKNPDNRSREWPASFVEPMGLLVNLKEFCANTAGARVCDAAGEEKTCTQRTDLTSARLEEIHQLNWYGTLSSMAGGPELISQDEKALSTVLQPLKDKFCRVEEVVTVNQSLEIISKIVDAGVVNLERLPRIFEALIGFNNHLISLEKSDYNDLLVKCFVVVKKLLVEYGGQFGDSDTSTWIIPVVELLQKVANCRPEASSGKVMYEAIGCITVIQKILYHVKETRVHVINNLLSCLKTCGISLKSGMLDFSPAAFKAFDTIWWWLSTSESQYRKEKAFTDPLSSMYCHTMDSHNVEGDERDKSLNDAYFKNIIHAVTKAFLRFKAIQFAFNKCIFHPSERAPSSAIQYDTFRIFFFEYVSLLPVTTVISGGGDHTIVSAIFSKLSWYARHPQSTVPEQICYLCLVLVTVAQSLKSVGRTSAELMLTSSPENQQSRLSDLAQLYSRLQNTKPYVMLGLASIFSLESSPVSSISEIALPLIPQDATLCNYLRTILTEDVNASKLPNWHGLGDGAVGLLEARLKWGGHSAIQQFCASSYYLTLLELLEGSNYSSQNEFGLSPVGVVWTVLALYHCLRDNNLIIQLFFLDVKRVKLISGLICEVHINRIRRWGGPGGGGNGVRDTVNAVINFLEYQFESLTESPVYIPLILKVGIPGQVVKCLEHVELKDVARPVGFIARMTCDRSIIDQLLEKGLFDPILMKRLLGTSSPRQVTLDILKIISDLAYMSKDFYERIKEADIFPFLSDFLTHEDPNVRAKACRAISNMCLHNLYFYSLMEKHNIVSLLVACYSDEDTDTSLYAGIAITNVALHNELQYKELGRCIPQLAKLLFSEKVGYRTKRSACHLMRALVKHSGKLCEDIIKEWAMEALIILVGKCLLYPNNQPEEKSLLDTSLLTLEKLCNYSSCRDYFHKSAHFSKIEQAFRKATGSWVAASVSHIFNKTSKL
uniref:serine/threonine-protein kinase TIO-like n=1 Tax=Erigeron canadensis TaxID=72917 RepID=UPI001CB8E70A|nr:serine/threonine-protein kinase TIO-like [Erigeron canadensis]